MANFFPIQTNFSGGVLSKRLHSRIDSPIYGKSVESCENWAILPQGSLGKRAGFTYLAPALNADIVRLIEMPSQTKWYTLELTPGKMRIFDQNGLVIQGGPEALSNSQFQFGLTGWTVNTAGGAVATANPTRRSVTLGAGTQGGGAGSKPGNVNQDFALKGLFLPSSTYTLAGTVAAQYPGDSIGVRITANNVSIFSGQFNVGTNALSFTTPATMATPIVIHYEHAGAWAIELVSPSVRKTVGTTEITTPWTTQEAIDALQFTHNAATDEVFFTGVTAAPYHLVHTDPVLDIFTFEVITFTMPPADWQAGNWPRCCELYQGRLWIASTPQAPNAVWASVTNDLYNFTVGTGANVTDALSFKVATKGGIRWLKSQKTMLVGTTLGEYIITASQAIGAVANNNINIIQQSAYGSAALQPVNIGDQVIFTSLDNNKVRAANYNLDTNGWVSPDVTFLAEAITSPGVKQVAFLRDPYEMIWCVLTDGTAAVCTYNRIMETMAWWKVTTNGTILSAVSSFYASGSLWVAVKRPNGTFIEIVSVGTAEIFFDNGITKPVDDNGEILGLNHLNGQTVGVTIDGAIYPDAVVTGNKLSGYPPAALFGTVGFHYTATLVTLPMEGGNPGGSAQGVMKGRDRIFTRIFNSALPLINGVRVQEDRTPSTPMDTPEGLRTCDALLASLGVDRFAKITLSQDLAAPTRVTGLFGRAQVNSL